MLDTLRDWSLAWYTLMSRFGSSVTAPIQGLVYRDLGLPFISALLLGVIGSLAPCQMSANISAIAFVSRRATSGKGTVWRDAAAYLAGKVIVYSAIGAAAILLGFTLPTWALVLLRKLTGPLMIIVGLYTLKLIRFHFVIGDGFTRQLIERLAAAQRALPGGDRQYGSAGSFLLGAIYALTFCPTMVLLFFGVLVPLGLRSASGVVLPAFFALGTALPLLAYVTFLISGLGASGDWLRGVRRADHYLRLAVGSIFLVLGVNDTILYWFL